MKYSVEENLDVLLDSESACLLINVSEEFVMRSGAPYRFKHFFDHGFFIFDKIRENKWRGFVFINVCGRNIFYIITKQQELQDTTVKNLRIKLQSVKECMRHLGYKNLAMPKICTSGNGDSLPWETVEEVIKDVFSNTEVQIKVMPFENNIDWSVVDHSSEVFEICERFKFTEIVTQQIFDGRQSETVYSEYWSSREVKQGLESGNLIQAALRVDWKTPTRSYADDPDGEVDILINGLYDRNRALPGDIVALEVRRPFEQLVSSGGTSARKTARVVSVIERHHSGTFVGKLSPISQDLKLMFFKPTESVFPTLLLDAHGLIHTWDSSNSDDLYVAKITDWQPWSMYPTGQLVGKLGVRGDLTAETQALLVRYGIDDSAFTPDVLKCLNTVPPESNVWNIPEKVIAGRRDFRHEMVFTIDPATAHELDDALHLRDIGNGVVEVGVHIADVSFFVRDGTPLDDIAAQRTSNVYLPNKMVPMLPFSLANQMCSLDPGIARLTFSVVWNIVERTGKILKEDIQRTVIRSVAKLSYDKAQRFIDDNGSVWESETVATINETEFSTKELSATVNRLHHIAAVLRKRRFDNGAIQLDKPSIRFCLDNATAQPVSCSVHQQIDSCKLVEEFMVLANVSVATRIKNSEYKNIAILRNHPSPHTARMLEQTRLLRALGYPIDGSSSKSLENSLSLYKDKLSEDEKVTYLAISHLCSKPMSRAQYYCVGAYSDNKDSSHYALSVPMYTHFTSPIRRYPDIMVHRVLATCLGYRQRPTLTPSDYEKRADRCNVNKKTLDKLDKSSNEMFFAGLLKNCGPRKERGIVIEIREHSFEVLIYPYGLQKRIDCEALSLSNHIYREGPGFSTMCLQWIEVVEKKSILHQKTIRLFDIVDLSLTAAEGNSMQYEASYPLLASEATEVRNGHR